MQRDPAAGALAGQDDTGIATRPQPLRRLDQRQRRRADRVAFGRTVQPEDVEPAPPQDIDEDRRRGIGRPRRVPGMVPDHHAQSLGRATLRGVAAIGDQDRLRDRAGRQRRRQAGCREEDARGGGKSPENAVQCLCDPPPAAWNRACASGFASVWCFAFQSS